MGETQKNWETCQNGRNPHLKSSAESYKLLRDNWGINFPDSTRCPGMNSWWDDAWKLLQSCDCHSVCVLVTPLCPTLCDPIDCSLPGPSVHGILQARILEWLLCPSPGESPQPRDWTWVSCITGRFFIIWATREVRYSVQCIIINTEFGGS